MNWCRFEYLLESPPLESPPESLQNLDIAKIPNYENLLQELAKLHEKCAASASLEKEKPVSLLQKADGPISDQGLGTKNWTAPPAARLFSTDDENVED